MRPSRPAAGYSLPELLVALALAAIIMVTGTALLIEFMHHAKMRAGQAPGVGGSADLALDALGHDLREAVVVATSAPGADGGTRLLEVTFADGAKVAWVHDGHRLVRQDVVRQDTTRMTKVYGNDLVAADVQVDGRLADIWVGSADSLPRHRTILLRNMGLAPDLERHR